MLPQTVSRNLIKFRNCKFNMIDYLKTKKRLGRPRKLIGSTELEKILLSDEILKRWAHLNI